MLSVSPPCLARCPSTWHTDVERCWALAESWAAGSDPRQPTGIRQLYNCIKYKSDFINASGKIAPFSLNNKSMQLSKHNKRSRHIVAQLLKLNWIQRTWNKCALICIVRMLFFWGSYIMILIMPFPCEHTEAQLRGYSSKWPISNTAYTFKQVTDYNVIKLDM